MRELLQHQCSKQNKNYISNLAANNSVVVLKQDKGKGFDGQDQILRESHGAFER